MKDSFGARLKFFRSKAGLSQQKLADKCGLSRKIISDYEVKLDVVPRDANLYKIADVLNIDSSNLVPKKNFNCGELHIDTSTEFTLTLKELPKEAVDFIKQLAQEQDVSISEILNKLMGKTLIEYIQANKKEMTGFNVRVARDNPVDTNETSFLEFLNSKT